jgi:outer membrane protein W
LKQLFDFQRKLAQTLKPTTMKKFMIFVSALTLSGTMFAQKPASDDSHYSLEGLANLNTVDGMSWTAPSLRLRYFVNDNIAARVQFGFGGDGTSVAGVPSTESYTYFENPDGTGASGTQEIKRGAYNLQLGAEYHLKGTEKMSPYFALGVNLGGGSYDEKWTNSDGTTYVNGLNATVAGGYSTFGVSLGAGFDYYIAENLYLGLEMNLSRSNVSYDAGVVTVGGAVAGYEPAYKESYTNIGAGHGSIRIGWRF